MARGEGLVRLEPRPQEPVVCRHGLRRDRVRDPAHRGDDRRRTEVEQAGAEPERLVARAQGGLADVAGREHDVRRPQAGVGELVRRQRPVGHAQRREERALRLVPPVRGDVDEVGAGQ